MQTSSIWMARRYVVLLCPFLVTACALPLPFQIASWTLDGLSLLITQKSVSDHGISVVMGEDCALYREFTEGQVCRPGGGDGTLVAVADDGAVGGDVTAEDLASFETAAGGPVEAAATPVRAAAAMPRGTEVASAGFDLPFVDDWNSASPESATQRAAISEINSKPAPVKLAAVKPAGIRSGKVNSKDTMLTTGLYFSLGSFRSQINAQKLTTLCPDLKPTVMPIEHQGGTFYRVVVGPVKVGYKPAVLRQIRAAGFYDAWTFTRTAAEHFPQPS